IHAAGLPDGALIANRDQQTSAKVLAPKVTGTLVLAQLLADTSLDFFILCSSLASVVGIPGQVAYCAANAFQDAFAQARRHDRQTHFSAVNWDTWQKVGMAVKAVTDPSAVAPGRTVAEHPLEIKHPLFYAYRKDGETISYLIEVSDKLWILNDHRIFGPESCVMPGTAYLEWARAALSQHHAERDLPVASTVFEEVYFLYPLVIENNTGKILCTALTPQQRDGESVYEFVISSETGDNKLQEYARGRIKAGTAGESAPYSLEELRRKCGTEVMTVSPHAIRDHEENANQLERCLRIFGQRWHNLRQVDSGEQQGLGFLGAGGAICRGSGAIPFASRLIGYGDRISGYDPYLGKPGDS
ncbi:MAG: KR domain-containing protein, partial [Candidatus Electrothrix sp. EH2]|nr:KR domain-containing protein [Candidatus Electrothrix sp. EH2]